MNYVLVFRPEVQEEVNEAYNWYEKQKLGLGDEFLDAVEQTLNRVSSMPESYQVVYRDVRRAVVKRFSSRVIVTAIFHARRDPKLWQTRN